MMPEETERVGAAFYQVDGRLARKYEGSGLGLRGGIERHGGKLIVKSQSGRGSQISVTFPSDLLEPVALAAVA
jgi:signal transduction histidine kinase